MAGILLALCLTASPVVSNQEGGSNLRPAPAPVGAVSRLRLLLAGSTGVQGANSPELMVVDLETAVCSAAWGAVPKLLPMLRVELMSSAVPVRVTIATGARRLIVVRSVDCKNAAETVVISLVHDQTTVVSRHVDLSDVRGRVRVRTLALVVVDLLRAYVMGPTPTTRAAATRFSEPSPASVPPVSASGHDPESAPSSNAATGAELPWPRVWAVEVASYGGVTAAALGRYLFFGGGLSVELPLGRPWLKARIGGHAAQGSGVNHLGKIELLVGRLVFGMEAQASRGSLAVGLGAEISPGLAWGRGQKNAAAKAGSAVDFVVGAQGTLQGTWSFHPSLFLRFRLGVGGALRGYTARAASTEVIAWRGALFCGGLGLGLRL